MEEKEAAAASNTERRIILVGVDDSEHSVYALKWTLNHFFGENAAAALVPNYKLVILHAKPIPSAVVGIGPGTSEAYIQVELCLKSSAAKALGVAKELCAANSVTDAVYEVVEGDARTVLCNAVEKYNADALVVGSHGYGSLKRIVLGSVSDYCAHHAHCTVMIVKTPKHKNNGSLSPKPSAGHSP